MKVRFQSMKSENFDIQESMSVLMSKRKLEYNLVVMDSGLPDLSMSITIIEGQSLKDELERIFKQKIEIY